MSTLRFQVKDASPSTYLTLISIIASMAFGYLLSIIKPEQLIGESYSFTYLLQTVTTLIAIIMMWHDYAMSAAVFKWVLNYLDSTIPFLFGIALFGLINSIDTELNNNWMYFLAFYCFIGALAYWNQNKKAEREPENRANFECVKKFQHNNFLSALLISIFLSIMAPVKTYVLGLYVEDTYWITICFVIFCLYGFYGHHSWNKALVRCYDLKTESCEKCGKRLT